MHDIDKQKFTELRQEMAACLRCVKAGYKVTAGAIFSGDIKSEIMVIGQAPGVTEVVAKRPFNAGSGNRLFQWLAAAGIDEDCFRSSQYMTAVTKCYPGKSNSGKGDRVPSQQERQYCNAFLNRELELVNPKLIIPVGSLAIQQFICRPEKLAEVVGRFSFWPDELSFQQLSLRHNRLQLLESLPEDLPDGGRWIIPLPHPSGASLWPNRPKNLRLVDQATRILNELLTRLSIPISAK